MSVRVRFAPSPTGTLHIGSARTALFNWLYAKHHNGTFILRIEDTDAKRSNPAFVTDIMESLAFLGIKADEGPLYQSQRIDLYRAYAEQLLAEGKAVREETAIIFQVKPQPVSFVDMIHGTITVDASLFEHIVLLKSDGLPAYNFACVVDDALMKITHIIRGDDHIANTPKQMVLYHALGFEPPQFAHIPLIVGADRARLSKRQGATSVNEYRTFGYLPEAFVNYLALLGWSPGNNQEYATPDELYRLFDVTRVRKTAAQFDQQKLDWLNGQHLKRCSTDRLTDLLAGRLMAKGWLKPDYDRAWLSRIADVVRDRLKVLQNIEEEHSYFFVEPLVYQQEAVDQYLRSNGVAGHLLELKTRLAALADFEPAAVEQVARQLIAEQHLESKDLIHPARVAVTGRAVSPPLFAVMSILGKTKVLSRLEYAITLGKP